MGGHGALYLFSQRPELFRSAGSTSGVFDLRPSSDRYGLTALLGQLSTEQVTWIRFSVMGNAEKIAAAQKEIIFDCGVSDRFYGVNNDFRQHFEFFKRLANQPITE
jgi:S-formylglutathione hydrolase FrmB